MQQKIFDDTQNNIRPHYVDGGPGCFGDSGGPLWRQVTDEKTKTVVPVVVGVFSYLLWGTCHGAQEPKFYGQVASIKDWINQYVPIEQTCEYSKFLTDHSKALPNIRYLWLLYVIQVHQSIFVNLANLQGLQSQLTAFFQSGVTGVIAIRNRIIITHHTRTAIPIMIVILVMMKVFMKIYQ